jgi:hypothetical protein
MGRQIMGAPIPPPPPVLDCARVLEYGVVNNSVAFSGRTPLFVNRIELGRVPWLAICESKRLPRILFFHCDAEWNVLGCVACATVKETKERTERTYPKENGSGPGCIELEAVYSSPPYTSLPPRNVASTFTFLIELRGILKMSSLSTTKSASLPNVIEPLSLS